MSTVDETPAIQAPKTVPSGKKTKITMADLRGQDLAQRKFGRKLIMPALIVAILSGALLATRLAAHFWPTVAESLRVQRLRATVRSLSEDAKAALRIATEGGKARFYGEPSQPYVQDLLKTGLITTDRGGDRNSGWGLYAFTEDGREISSYGFKSFHDLIEQPAQKLASIRTSMKHAEGKAPR